MNTTNPTKILFVLPAYTIGGTMSSLVNMLEALNHDKEYMIDFFAVSPDGPYRNILSKYGHVIGGKQDSNMNQSFSLALIVRRIKRMLSKIGVDITPFVFKRTARSLEKKGYDIVVGFQENYATHLVSYFEHTYKIAWIHCDYKNYLALSKRKPEKWCYNKIDKVVCVSNYTLKQFESCIPHKNAIFLHNIILDNQIRLKANATIEPDLFPKNHFCIISVGRFNPVKQFSKIPQIIYELKKNCNRNTIWYLIGGGDEDELKAILEEKKKYGIKELVLLGEKANPYPYMSKADLYVCTSKSEACPYVINESKILGVPIVTTQFGSVNEFIKDGVDGLIGTIEELPMLIERYINNAELRNTLTTNLESFNYPNNSILDSLRSDVLKIE